MEINAKRINTLKHHFAKVEAEEKKVRKERNAPTEAEKKKVEELEEMDCVMEKAQEHLNQCHRPRDQDQKQCKEQCQKFAVPEVCSARSRIRRKHQLEIAAAPESQCQSNV